MDNIVMKGLKGLFNLVITGIAIVALVLREPRLWLKQKVYAGGAGWFRGFLGLLLATGASYSTAQQLGWEHNWPLLAWVGCTIAAWYVTFAYAWPALYHFVIRKVFDLVDYLTKKLQEALRKYAEKVFNGFILGVGYVLPGSRRAWNVVLNKERHLWTNGLIGFFGWLAGLAATCFAGWTTFNCVWAFSFWGIPTVSLIAAITAGVLVLGLVGAVLFSLINNGKIAFVAIGLTGGLTYLFSGWIMAVGASAGLPAAYAPASLAIFAVAFLWYVFPYVSWALSGDLVKKIFDKIEALSSACYRDKNEGYVKFFAHLGNIVSTVALSYGAWWVCGKVGLAAWSFAGAPVGLALSVLIVVVAAVVAYLEVYEFWFDKRSRLANFGVLASVYVGYKATMWYVGASLTGGYWLGVPTGILAASLVGYIAIPLVYLGLRWVLLKAKADKAGEPLDKAHKWVEAKSREIGKYLGKVYEHSYRDRSDYQKWFLHASNIGVAVALYFLTASLCSWLGLGVALTYTVIVAAVTLSYILVGEFLHRSNVGTEFLGAISGMAAGIYVGVVVHTAIGSWLVTILLGLTAASSVWFIFFPVAYILVRLVAKPLLASWTLNALAWVHSKAWKVWKVAYDQVVAMYRLLKVKVLVPIKNKMAEIWAAVVEAYLRIRNRGK